MDANQQRRLRSVMPTPTEVGQLLDAIAAAEARAERYREALQVVRDFGVFTTYNPGATDQENDELQRRYQRIRKALAEALADPRQERDAR